MKQSKQMTELRNCVSKGLECLNALKNMSKYEYEVYASRNHRYTMRLNLTTHILCNGVQELKSDTNHGVGLRISTKDKDTILSGSGGEARDLTLNGVKASLRKAKETLIPDPRYVSLPKPVSEKPSLVDYHDGKLVDPQSDTLTLMAQEVLEGALDEFINQGYGNVADDLIIGGDVTLLSEQMAIGSSHGIAGHDTSTILMANITTMIESEDAKGSGWGAGTSLENFSGYEAGKMAAKSAVSTIGGVTIPSGNYDVILGPQPVCVLFANLMVRDMGLMSYASGMSNLKDKLGKKALSELINVYDDGSVPGMMASKSITCEGLPTGRTDLIRGGKLVGLLSDTYWLNSPENKTGLTTENTIPRSGFRFGGGGRYFNGSPSTHATNLYVSSPNPVSSKELLRNVRNGIYIGRLWYLYPINLGQADFTGTIVADSYLIKDGKLAEPLKPNKVRLNDNWLRLFQDHVIGVSDMAVPTIVWAGEEIVVAPEIALSDMSLEEIDVLYGA